MIEFSNDGAPKIPFWRQAFLGFLFIGTVILYGAFGFGKRQFESDRGYSRPVISAIASDSSSYLHAFSPVTFSQPRSFRPGSLSYSALTVTSSENIGKPNESLEKSNKKVLLAFGNSIVSQTRETRLSGETLTALRENLQRIQDINLKVDNIYQVEGFYNSLLKNVFTEFKNAFSPINPEYKEYRLTVPDRYQQNSENLSGLSGVRSDGTSANITKRKLKWLLTGGPDNQMNTLANFSHSFQTNSPSEIAEKIQNFLISCQHTYVELRHQELSVQDLTEVQDKLRLLATNLSPTEKSKALEVVSCDLKFYLKPLERLDWQLAGSLNFTTQDLSLGIGQARFYKIPKTPGGVIYGIDVGPKFRRISDSSLSYSYIGLEGRVFVGIGFGV